MKFVLHHIPKTGGHSIVQSFRAIFGPDAVDVDEGDAPLITTHGPSWRMFEDYPDRLHITILRDPVERVKSYIRYMRGVVSNTNGEDIAKLARDLPPEMFLTRGQQAIRHMTCDRQVRQLGAGHFDEQVTTRTLDRALESLKRMAWVGHTETLTEDLDALFGKLNPRLEPQNTSSRPAIGDVKDIDGITVWDERLLLAWARR